VTTTVTGGTSWPGGRATKGPAASSPGRYDGAGTTGRRDGKADPAVYRAGAWLVRGGTPVTLGRPDDVPIALF